VLLDGDSIVVLCMIFLCTKVESMYHVPFSLTSSLAQWTQSDQGLLDKSSGQTTLSLVCILVFVIYLPDILLYC